MLATPMAVTAPATRHSVPIMATAAVCAFQHTWLPAAMPEIEMGPPKGIVCAVTPSAPIEREPTMAVVV